MMMMMIQNKKRQDGGRGLGHPGSIVQLRLGGADRP